MTNIATGIQGRASQLIDFSIGSPLRAIAEGFAGLFLWMQALVLELLQAMRLSTATGTDVDSFTGDFGVYRLLAQPASGTVILSRLSIVNTPILIPFGAIVQTNPGITVITGTSSTPPQPQQQYVVVANPTFIGYSAAAGGYIMAPNTGSMTVPIQALTPGSGGNVVAGAINQLGSPVTGIDTVSNPSALLNGFNSEADQSLKNRFAAFILGLSRGDYFGTEYAVLSAGITVQWTLTEDYDYAGNWNPGYYYVVADDGSGAPSAAFMTAITNAVNSVRPLGIQAGTFPSVIQNVIVSLSIQTATGFDHNTVAGLVANAIQNNVNSLGLGNGMEFGLIYSWAYSVAGVTGVSAALLDGLTGDVADIPPNNQISLKCPSCICS